MRVVAFPVELTLSNNGTVSRGVCALDTERNLLSITERTKIMQTESGIAYRQDELYFPIASGTLVSMNCWALDPIIFKYLEHLFTEFLNLNGKDKQAEFYLPIAINTLIHQGLINVKVETTSDEWFGITYSEDKQTVVSKIKERISLGKYPAALWQ
jgi:hypothetical protein